MDLMQIIPEVIVGMVLGALAWAFQSWSKTLDKRSEQILKGQEKISQEQNKISTEVHEHRLENESRMMKVETDLKHIFKRLDRCEIVTKANHSQGD